MKREPPAAGDHHLNTRASLRWIPQAVRRLASAKSMRGRSWTLAQVCEHLALAIEGTVSDPDPTPGPPRSQAHSTWYRFRRRCIKHALLTTGRFPRNVPAPDTVAPSDSPSLEETITRLEIAIRTFEQKLASASPNWTDHPILGSMSGRQWRRFHSIHAAHHLACFHPGTRPPRDPGRNRESQSHHRS